MAVQWFALTYLAIKVFIYVSIFSKLFSYFNGHGIIEIFINIFPRQFIADIFGYKFIQRETNSY